LKEFLQARGIMKTVQGMKFDVGEYLRAAVSLKRRTP